MRLTYSNDFACVLDLGWSVAFVSEAANWYGDSWVAAVALPSFARWPMK